MAENIVHKKSKTKVILVHAFDAMQDHIKLIVDTLCLNSIPCEVVPSQVPAGYNHRTFICDIIASGWGADRHNYTTLFIVLITFEFKECEFGKFVIEKALYESCIVIPIRVKQAPPPPLISHLNSIDIDDGKLSVKLIASLEYAIGANIEGPENVLTKYGKLELVHPPTTDPIPVTHYWKRLTAKSRIGQKGRDYRVVVRPTITDEGRKNKEDIMLLAKLGKVIIKGNQQDDAIVSSQLLLIWSEVSQPGEQTFWLRFRKLNDVCHVFVSFDLMITHRHYREGKEGVLADSVCLEFVTEAATEKSTTIRGRPRRAVSGYDGDEDDDYALAAESLASTSMALVRRGQGTREEISLDSLEFLLHRLPKKFVVKVDGNGPFNSSRFQSIMLNLELLGENSSDGYQSFYETANKYLAEVGATVKKKWVNDYELAILLKMVGVAIYRNKADEAHSLLERGLALLPLTSCTDHMEGRLAYYASAVYREEKNLGKAKEWVDISQQKLGMLEPCEDSGKGYFNAGKLYMKMLSDQKYHSIEALNATKKLAIDNFLWAIQHFQQQPDEGKKQIKRCLLNMVSVIVQSPHTAHGRDRRVSAEDLKLAERVIKHLNSITLGDDTQTFRNLVQVYGSESEVFYREACLHLEKCQYYDRELPFAEHRCRCSSKGNCEHTKKAIASFRQSMSKLQLLTTLSRAYGFKEADKFAGLTDHVGAILARHTRPPVLLLEEVQSESTTDEDFPEKVNTKP